MRKNQAFSLIELSIVILVIGILISGIIKGQRLINDFRIQSARSLTNSSPISSIQDLALWLEPTLKDSFTNDYPEDKDRIAAWRDINPQTTRKNNAIQSDENLRPYFITNAINGLPAIYFTPNSKEILEGEYIINSHNAATGSFSFFLVALSSETGNYQTAFETSNTEFEEGWKIDRLQSFYNNQIRLVFCNNTNCAPYGTQILAPDDKAIMMSVVLNDSNKLTCYIDGIERYTRTSVAFPKATTKAYRIGNDQQWINAGGSGAWRGYIGEIILFNRALGNTDRKHIEEYLGQKWGISVSD